jgi:hypothetical protein
MGWVERADGGLRFVGFQEGVAWISSTRRITIPERSLGIVASLLSSWNGGLTRAKGAEQRTLRLAVVGPAFTPNQVISPRCTAQLAAWRRGSNGAGLTKDEVYGKGPDAGQIGARWGEPEKGAGRRRFWGSAGRV